MMEPKKYSKILLWTLLPVWCVITWFVLTTPPFEGDMTRIGGYSEKDFGQNAPRLRFSEPAFDTVFSLQEYTNAYDVVVVGDSFSQNRAYGWQNFLAEKTGWSILTFHQSDVNLSELVRSPMFLTHPPKILIYEIVEHGSHGFSFEDRAVALEKKPFLPKLLSMDPRDLERARVEPPNGISLHMEHGAHRLKRWLKRVTGSGKKAYRLKLDRNDFFSNTKSGEILIYHGDYWKNEVPTQQWDKVAERLLGLQDMVQSNGETLFLFMLAADKGTIYRDHIINAPQPLLSGRDLLGDISGLNMIPIHEALSAAALDGKSVDVFLPNDAHWGYVGYETAAEAILTWLREKDLVPR